MSVMYKNQLLVPTINLWPYVIVGEGTQHLWDHQFCPWAKELGMFCGQSCSRRTHSIVNSMFAFFETQDGKGQHSWWRKQWCPGLRNLPCSCFTAPSVAFQWQSWSYCCFEVVVHLACPKRWSQGDLVDRILSFWQRADMFGHLACRMTAWAVFWTKPLLRLHAKCSFYSPACRAHVVSVFIEADFTPWQVEGEVFQPDPHAFSKSFSYQSRSEQNSE